jgi:hypothetical protein
MQQTNGFDFLETLPDSCPPSTVTQPNEDTLWRLIKAPVVFPADFKSQRARLPDRAYPDECLARSVSLMTTLAACRLAMKSPYMARMKFSHAIPVPYDTNNGVWHQDGPTHVNWWPYKSVDPLTIVGEVEDLNG